MTARRPLVAGNWKMNGLSASLAELGAVKSGIGNANCDVAICPPATLIRDAATAASGSALVIGAQDCHSAASGAHTGDISAEMIADAGGKLVIVGHSERRADHDEDDALVRAKAEAAWRAGLMAILCVGETAAQRASGDTMAVLESQIAGSVPKGSTAANLVVAYEPVWAIGTGDVPSNDDIAAAHAHIRARLVDMIGAEAVLTRILYGGSVKPSNAASILALSDVDGALVGGASLKAVDFLGIVGAAS
jgi:triosephosphate isomerase (TIM)